MKIKLIILSALMTVVLTGCDERIGEPATNARALQTTVPRTAEQAALATVSKQPQTGKTFFSFDTSSTVFLDGNQTRTVGVTATPAYEPITSVQVVLNFDGSRVRPGSITPAEGIMVFQQEIDIEKGILVFVGATPDGFFGEKLPLFSFDISSAPESPKGESPIRFDTEQLWALLPDVHNTDTAHRENINPLVVSIL